MKSEAAGRRFQRPNESQMTWRNPLEHTLIQAGELKLHAVQAGPEEGHLVLLLHGFPEFWFCWREQIGALAAAGYRVVALDQRGYNTSEKPSGVNAYCIDSLAEDVAAAIGALGREKASIVGHDWGAIVGWWLASFHAGAVERLVVINAPHPQVMWRALQTSWAQRFRSWYVLLFQIPWVPEWVVKTGNWALLCQALVSSSRKGTFHPVVLDEYRKAWQRPGAISAMLNWYRAIPRSIDRLSTGPAQEKIDLPTLVVWGAQDRFLGVEMAEPSLEYCRNGQLAVFPEATHWMQLEEPQRLNELLITFLGGTGLVATEGGGRDDIMANSE